MWKYKYCLSFSLPPSNLIPFPILSSPFLSFHLSQPIPLYLPLSFSFNAYSSSPPSKTSSLPSGTGRRASAAKGTCDSWDRSEVFRSQASRFLVTTLSQYFTNNKYFSRTLSLSLPIPYFINSRFFLYFFSFPSSKSLFHSHFLFQF